METSKKQVFYIYLIYFISMLAFVGVRIMSASGVGDTWSYYLTETFYSFLIQICIMIVLPLVLTMLLLHKKPEGIKSMAHIHRLNGRAVGICVIIGIVVFFCNIAVSSIFGSIISTMGYETPIVLSSRTYPSGGIVYFLFDLLMTAVLPALCEEFLHRGILLGGIEGVGYKKAIVISSVLFGMLHFSINKVFYAAVLGLIIAFMVIITNNIWCGIIVHFMNNAINVYITHAELNGWFGGGFFNTLNNFLVSSNFFVTFICCLCFMLLVISLLIYLLFKLYNNTTLKKVNDAIEAVYSDEEKKNSPIETGKTAVIRELIETNTTLNVDFDYIKNPVEIMLPKQKTITKDDIIINVFLISSFTLGVLINLSTFIWGLF